MNYERNKRRRKQHPELRRDERNRYYARTSNAVNNRKLWTSSEDQQVLARLITDTELARRLGRSVKAIQIRRNRLTSEPPSAQRP